MPASFDAFVCLVAAELQVDLDPGRAATSTFAELGLDSLHRLELLDLVDRCTGGEPLDPPPAWVGLGDAYAALHRPAER